MNLPAKNISPRQLALLAAAALAAPTILLIMLFGAGWMYAGIGGSVIFAISYFLISYILEKFIYRKIKLIYKFIHQTKAGWKEETYYKYLLPRKSIDEVSAEVEEWADDSRSEMALLRRNEQFRKEFLQNLAHEFRNPVFAIQGYMDSLLEVPDQPELRRKFLEHAARNVERLTNLLEDLDQISRLEAGEIPLSRKNFVIQDLVREVFDSLSIHAERRTIRMNIKKGCEQPLMVNADREKIRQVLSNLVENSIKYGKTGGNIVASMYNTDDRHVLVELSDDGIGIHEKNIGRVFERFYRTEEGRALDATGTGLGLAICKHIVEAHGQAIHVRSTEHLGTTVGFTLNSRREENE